jgi:hypothetical protein
MNTTIAASMQQISASAHHVTHPSGTPDAAGRNDALTRPVTDDAPVADRVAQLKARFDALGPPLIRTGCMMCGPGSIVTVVTMDQARQWAIEHGRVVHPGQVPERLDDVDAEPGSKTAPDAPRWTPPTRAPRAAPRAAPTPRASRATAPRSRRGS